MGVSGSLPDLPDSTQILLERGEVWVKTPSKKQAVAIRVLQPELAACFGSPWGRWERPQVRQKPGSGLAQFTA